MELNREYKLGVVIKTVAEIVADALVLPPRPLRAKGEPCTHPAACRGEPATPSR